MKILVISQRYYPENFRINDITFELAKRGNEITVLTGIPNYPEGEIYPGYENKQNTIEIINGVKVIRCKELPRKKGAIHLFMNYMSFMSSSCKKVKKLKDNFDLILVNQLSPVFQIKPGVIAKKKMNIPLITYCYDIWPESLKAGGIGENNPAYKMIWKMSKKLYNKSDLILNTTKSFAKYLHEKNNVPYEKMIHLPQPYDDIKEDVNYQKEKNETIDLMFAGNIGKVQNVTDIIEAYNIIKNPRVKIHIFGNGSEYDKCLELVKKYQVENNVILYGRKPLSEINEFYKNVDACLLTLSGKNDIGLTAPAKLMGYMMAGKMILAAAKGDTCEILDDSKCGIYAKPDDALALAELINQYVENYDSYCEYGQNGKRYFKNNYTLEIFLNRLENILSKEVKNEHF